MEVHSKHAVNSLLFCALLFSSAGNISAYEIQGRVFIQPPYPESKPVPVESKKKDSCATQQVPQGLLVSPEGGVRNAVVWLEGSFERKLAAQEPAPLLDQKACRFEPHVLLLPENGSFRVGNDDPVTHDVRGFDGMKMLFRFEMEPGTSPVEQRFGKAGIHLLRCGFHGWMHALVVSAPHAYYAVTDEEGRFHFKDVPEGARTLHIWHETLGEDRAVVAGTQPVENFSYTFKKA